jgi:transcriptional regulator with PAS, ATPase and Fis domain
MSDYFREFNAAVTVCDTEGIVIWMNDKSKLVNHGDFTGKNLLDCHPEPAKTKLLDLMKNQHTNVYTIEKGDIKKMIYQSPWYESGIYAGIVELSMEIPFEAPHYIRKQK